jgi:hypothetical protein
MQSASSLLILVPVAPKWVLIFAGKEVYGLKKLAISGGDPVFI